MFEARAAIRRRGRTLALGRLVALVLAAVLASRAGSEAPLAAAEPPCEFDAVDRVVAVGDVHGAYEPFVEILQAAAIVDSRARWVGGKVHLVQLGDVVDRGPDSRRVLDLLRRLEREAARAGGRVHALLGNHEALRLLGMFAYTTPGEYLAFTTPESPDLRRQLVDAAPPDLRERLLSETPLGMIEMIQAFGPKGSYGSFLRTHPAVVRINGVVFVHGGISPSLASTTCAEINARVRTELSADLENTRNAPAESLAMGEDGPLWYRGLAEDTAESAPSIETLLAAQGASAMVVGHTVRLDGRIDVRFGGRVFVIDTGMQAAYAPDGGPSALEIRDRVYTAIYPESREIVARKP